MGGPYGAAKAHCCVAVDESRSSLAACCVSFYQIVCLSLSQFRTSAVHKQLWLDRLARRSLSSRRPAARQAANRDVEGEPIRVTNVEVQQQVLFLHAHVLRGRHRLQPHAPQLRQVGCVEPAPVPLLAPHLTLPWCSAAPIELHSGEAMAYERSEGSKKY